MRQRGQRQRTYVRTSRIRDVCWQWRRRRRWGVLRGTPFCNNKRACLISKIYNKIITATTKKKTITHFLQRESLTLRRAQRTAQQLRQRQHNTLALTYACRSRVSRYFHNIHKIHTHTLAQRSRSTANAKVKTKKHAMKISCFSDYFLVFFLSLLLLSKKHFLFHHQLFFFFLFLVSSVSSLWWPKTDDEGKVRAQLQKKKIGDKYLLKQTKDKQNRK